MRRSGAREGRASLRRLRRQGAGAAARQSFVQSAAAVVCVLVSPTISFWQITFLSRRWCGVLARRSQKEGNESARSLAPLSMVREPCLLLLGFFGNTSL